MPANLCMFVILYLEDYLSLTSSKPIANNQVDPSYKYNDKNENHLLEHF